MGRKWLECLLLALWEFARLLWDNRNETKYQQDNKQTKLEITHMNRNIIWLYNKLYGTVLENDRYLFITPLTTLLKKKTAFKQDWINQASAVSDVQRERLCQTSYSNTITPAIMGQMRNMMAAWLTPHASLHTISQYPSKLSNLLAKTLFGHQVLY